MASWPVPAFRTIGEISLIGKMAVYGSQSEASEGIPNQWNQFLKTLLAGGDVELYGASPCTDDRKIHYLTGMAATALSFVDGWESVTLEAGEYAFVQVNDVDLLRDTWVWLLGTWLPASGRRERNAPEFERMTRVMDTGKPIGPVEIWIPLEPKREE